MILIPKSELPQDVALAKAQIMDNPLLEKAGRLGAKR